MRNIPDSITSLSARHGFYRSAKYDQSWMFDNSMGPNPLWLLEWLSRDMELSENMIVLDMGCGKAITSVFLAQEFGCTVFANDLWISPDDNLARIKKYSLLHKVFPIRVEAHALPYARDFFDAITCIDTYQYYGTDELYLEYFSKLVRPGGQIGLVVPGWLMDPKGRMPPHLEAFPLSDFITFHTCDWWREHLSRTGFVEIKKCDYMPNGKRIWLDSARAMYETKRLLRASDGTPPEEMKKELDFWKGDIDYLEADKDDYIALIRVIATRRK